MINLINALNSLYPPRSLQVITPSRLTGYGLTKADLDVGQSDVEVPRIRDVEHVFSRAGQLAEQLVEGGVLVVVISVDEQDHRGAWEVGGVRWDRGVVN